MGGFVYKGNLTFPLVCKKKPSSSRTPQREFDCSLGTVRTFVFVSVLNILKFLDTFDMLMSSV